jgi:3-hydroxyacyl-CoA dehydrogenase
MTKIALIGCGLVSGSWSLVFACAGVDVTLHDSSQAAIDTALDFTSDAASALAELDLLNGQSPADIIRQLKPVSDLAAAVHDADYIQESVPERLTIKQDLYKRLAALAKADAVIASSASGLPASFFRAEIEGRERCVVAHPINPPHLILLVEIVPAPWTSPVVVERNDVLMRHAGQVPIRLSREVEGFVVTRLQSAILNEAFRMVEDGISSVSDMDSAVTNGLGLRWFFMGPFETIDLNTQGVRPTIALSSPMYYNLAKEQADPRRWSEALVRTVEKQRRERQLRSTSICARHGATVASRA